MGGVCCRPQKAQRLLDVQRAPSFRRSFASFRRQQANAAKAKRHGQNRRAVKAAAGELHTAACQDDCSMIASWLCSCDPDFRLAVLEYGGLDGWTGLHFASRHGRPRAASLLLDAGASTAAKDDYGKTPIHYAQVYADSDHSAAAHREVLRLLSNPAAATEAADKVRREVGVSVTVPVVVEPVVLAAAVELSDMQTEVVVAQEVAGSVAVAAGHEPKMDEAVVTLTAMPIVTAMALTAAGEASDDDDNDELERQLEER